MKILNIKWEKIFSIVIAILFMNCIAIHIMNNGFDFEIVMTEVFIYGLVLYLNYIGIHYIRLDFKKDFTK